MDEIRTLRYSDIFLAMYFNDARSCTHRNHTHVLVYIYSGELEINERGTITRLHKGMCAFIRRDNQVQLTKQSRNGEQFKAIFLMFTRNFLREFYQTLDKTQMPSESKRDKVSVCKLPPDRPDIISLFESMTPYFDSSIQPTDALLKLKMIEGVYVLLNTDKNFYSSLFDFSEPWKIDILGYLNENYMYDLSMEEIASYTGRSLASFKRDFKKISTLSPQKWLIHKRLEVAQWKFRNENKKVSDVCFEVGFKNLSHFSTAFKQQYGFSPAKQLN
ncbi:MAG: Exoenzyme S synthesis regulatory protein ExsA [Candidatus Ordinivivax streblomastigis]|uniref:Exoenzyme S synthesis regulatory protein ExsA n=1 Tax=Candidatus Ordinivivax streblomastigis TaxID=2540710 RepID=A0A5M8NT39_9BACT|nr:MAG: Exoenzyme S synthesis regulatory protein ExsA [Candidatus Ordinivivax streblomastigis]